MKTPDEPDLNRPLTATLSMVLFDVGTEIPVMQPSMMPLPPLSVTPFPLIQSPTVRVSGRQRISADDTSRFTPASTNNAAGGPQARLRTGSEASRSVFVVTVSPQSQGTSLRKSPLVSPQQDPCGQGIPAHAL